MLHRRIDKTPLEWLLHAWTAVNLVVGIFVIVPMLANEQVRATGYLFVAVSLLAVLLMLAAVLVWKLFRPTFAVLLAGTVFWGLQIFSLRQPDALYLLRLGLSMDFRLTSNPDFILAVNVLAVMVALLFAVAAKERWDANAASTAARGRN
ncbi:hypothetical protein DFR29_102357 [Tahibacter aquaticus]|uniref:Uncharacterized protein n=1 Tax=Tahibacter aquaticus TaxID=520092 RepID=A0A4R6Z7C9_9GAMM|nr:hypothetical protein [Tahibacter aquaticus]TDR47697.1 hypothetical protein DFR29_102357 [Tahibacter aquaticus]